MFGGHLRRKCRPGDLDESRRLCVFANDDKAQAVLIAIYDNLGKGASGAAVQNLNLMLGVKADTSLAA